jgi:16S rRNA (cytosine967-C5)-methyltransferase
MTPPAGDSRRVTPSAAPPGPAAPPGLAARQAALRLLDAVLRRGETLDQVAGNACRGLPQEDAALAMAIAAESLRWLVDLDALLDSVMNQPLPADAKARSVLRLMLAQTLRLGTPPHAVLATGLPLLTGGPRRLAHGVFSTLLKRGAALPPAPTLPPMVAARWGVAWPGRENAIAAAMAAPPPLDLTLREGEDAAHWAERLGGRSLLPNHVRLARGDAVPSLPGYGEGAWWVQDLAASLPARLFGPGQGRRALDMCAAPGGKTLQLAAAGWRVTALDRSEKRLDRLAENLARTRLEARIVAADAREWEPDAAFDAVLLDAPCTATGTCRRHPDVLHRIAPAQIAELAGLQRDLLARAAGWVAPGGRLVYAVCSLEPEESEAQARTLAGLTPDPLSADDLPQGLVPTAEGWLRSDPGMLAEEGGIDGFFIARWRR